MAVPFPCLVEGPESGELVVLLHGFPQRKEAWRGVMADLASAGYRAAAFDQRGYRGEREPYPLASLRLDRLADDVLAVSTALEQERFHVVGHDWGGAVAWELAADSPDRLLTSNVVATPHPRALIRSMVGIQAARSLYMLGFQVPVVPEALLRARGGAFFRASLRRSGLDPDAADEYASALLEGSGLTNALGWYRANVPSGRSVGPARVPTLYMWPERDVALGRRAAERTAAHVDAPYRFVVLEGATHWAPEQRPGDVAALLLDHLRTTPTPPRS
ncbi:MAG: alpha/beta fold hydrolase [Actinobacteria bacterium]|nr:alpha/beta fold hydrolase [Actinomycetota bacterium]MBV9254690.1 alpha/beta fold hydrolase [Actinomycetota bacterium]MBV9933491.1 alpha/beta fold hydrolase [Actinomycetota bacterium]